MFEFITDKQERGQVGIGTLIVFIAMVLVAAIAAGVLINTAGFLQSQAEATGEESTDLVSERIDVTSTVGIVGDDDQDGLSEIRISVAGSPGADQIDLSETTIQAVGPNGQANLVFTDRDAGGEEFNYEGDQDDEFALQINQGEFVVLKNDEIVEDGDAVINEDDQFTIVVNPAAEPFGSLDDSDSSDGVFEESEGFTAENDPEGVDFFSEGQSSSLDIVSPSSATTSTELRAPDLFGDEGEAVRL